MLFDPSAIGINIAAFHLFDSVASPALTSIMSAMADSFIIVIPLVAAYLLLKKDRNFYAFVAAFVISVAVGEVLKYVLQEPRPCSPSFPQLAWVAQTACEGGFALPSTHATMLTGMFVFLDKYRIPQAAYIVWMLLVLFGRVYLGEHFLTDVLAGAALSLIIVYLVYHYRDSVYGLAKRLRLNFLLS